MKRGIVVLALTLSVAPSAHAAPGDPHLVQGTLEWPAKLTAEPFVVLRGEDGRWYYADIKAAKRLESAPLTTGARVAILGTEATRPHEITAIAIGSGDAAALAMALMPHVSPPATSTARASSASPPAPVAESPNVVKPAKPEPSAKKPEPPAAATPAPATKAAQPAHSDSAPPADLQAGQAKESPTPARETPPPAKESAVAAKAPVPSDASSAVKPVVGAAARPAGSSRWSELRGTVESIAGHWVVVKADDGQLVLVDFSNIRGATTSLKAGSPIVVYGTAGEQRFQAMGIVQHENRTPTKAVTTPSRR